MLSKLYLCNTGYNPKDIFDELNRVVNCFQNCTFVILDTTGVPTDTFLNSVVNCFQNCTFVILDTTDVV